MEDANSVLPEGVIHEGSTELLKLGLAGLVIIGLLYLCVVLWKDNLKIRKQVSDDQEIREKRDDARFGEVKALAERASTALEKSSASLIATSAAADMTNTLIDKQGNLIEARTAVFQGIMTAAAVNQQILQGNREAIESCKRAVDALSQRVDNLLSQRSHQGGSR